MREVVIVSAVRTPIGSFYGSLAPFSAVDQSLLFRETCLAVCHQLIIYYAIHNEVGISLLSKK